MAYSSRPCRCGSGKYHRPLLDVHGIFCTYVCDDCETEKRSHYRAEIFTDPTLLVSEGETIEPDYVDPLSID